MNDGDFIEQCLDEWQHQRASGLKPDLEKICQERPDLLPLIRQRAEAFAAMDHALGEDVTTVPPSSGAEQAVDSGKAKSQESRSHMMLANAKYRVVRFHAKGGLGEVLVAQDEQLRRQVAIKRILGDRTTDSSRRQRFLREAAITGQLDHPGVVSILNVGEDETGNPCYAMKFIDGKSLDQYARELHEPFESRQRTDGRNRHYFQSHVLRPLLSRFISVCNTIAFAHSRGIIHRDLKPANIMLGDFGATYVVDWGLARTSKPGRKPAEFEPAIAAGFSETILTGHSLTADDEASIASETLTRTGTVMGTPAYMSPEQAAGDAFQVGPQSDIYCLGATLYFLLTGRAPIVSSEGMKWLDQLKSGTFPKPRSVNPLVPAALESICLKAMELAPGDRYATASDLRSDIELWLADEPVSAHSDSLPTQLARFSRRHRAWTFAILLATSVIAVGAVISTILVNYQIRIATIAKEQAEQSASAERQARTTALAAAEAARQASETATLRLVQVEKMNAILSSMFQNLDPEEIAKNEVPVQVLLAGEIEKVASGLTSENIGDPLIVAKLQQNLGQSLINLSQPSKAIPILRLALSAFQKNAGNTDANTIACQVTLGEAILATGNFEESTKLLEEALIQARLSLPDAHPQKAGAMGILGSAYQANGRIPEAIALYQEALAIRRKALGNEHADTVTALNNLAMGYRAQGKLEEAAQLLTDVSKQTRIVYGPNHPRTVTADNNLGIALFSMGQVTESLPLFEETLKLRRQLLGRDHFDTMGAMNNLAANYMALSRWDEAVSLLQETAELTERKFGPDHPGCLSSKNNLGYVLLQMGQPEKALPVLEKILEQRRNVLGKDHPETLNTQLNVGLAMLKTGQQDAGLSLLESTFTDCLNAAGIDHRRTMEILTVATDEYSSAGRIPDAERLFQKALDAIPQDQQHQSITYAQILTRRGGLYLRLNQWSTAEPLIRDALTIRKALQPEAPQTFSSESMLGQALLGQEKYTEAEPLLLSAAQGLQTHPLSNPRQHQEVVAGTINALIRLYEATNQPDKVQEWKGRLPEKAEVPKLRQQ